MIEPTPFQDHAADVLRDVPTISDATKADLWDAFHVSKSPEELAQLLQGSDWSGSDAVPPEVKDQLVSAKQASMAQPAPAPSPTAKALLEMAQLPPEVLQMAEAHPKIASAFIAAAAKRSEMDAKGTEAGGSESASESALKPDIPITPEGHALVQASDGGLHHIPAPKIGEARKLDPTLTILHVEPVKAANSKKIGK